MSKRDVLILNYNDAVLYSSDLAILESKSAWLNDACIHFFLTRLSKIFFDGNFSFIDPSVLSFFMHQWDEEDDDGDEDILGLKSKGGPQQQQRLVFLPMNDNYISHMWRLPGGGIHWSLLVVVLPSEEEKNGSGAATSASQSPALFLHFDSSSGCNQKAAQAVSQKIYNVMEKWKGKDHTSNDKNKEVAVQECTVPQQENGYDCGIHTLATAEALAKAFEKQDAGPCHKESSEEIIQKTVATSPSFCVDMRQRIVKDIEALIAKN
jgi:sentrin-specific protease 8